MIRMIRMIRNVTIFPQWIHIIECLYLTASLCFRGELGLFSIALLAFPMHAAAVPFLLVLLLYAIVFRPIQPIQPIRPHCRLVW